LLLFETVADLQNHLHKEVQGKEIGFVPTMGALHSGHLSLIQRSCAENDLTVCSIFVNPVQFNDRDDLVNYPRDKDGDINMLKTVKCDVLFYPNVKEIYPDDLPKPLSLGSVENKLEGSYRPGHFSGVSTVVRRFFEIMSPDRAYFGLKDYQQFVIVKTMSEKLNLKTEVVGCETIREIDGLAMSSRNRLLSGEGRKAAVLFSKSLKEVKSLIESESLSEIQRKVLDDFHASKLCELEYFEIVDSDTLEKVVEKENHSSIVACIAGYVDGVRLIDNLILIP